ncbi:MAG: GH92 family glycosyl hydrolase [Janthinobacterium lividum]
MIKTYKILQFIFSLSLLFSVPTVIAQNPTHYVQPLSGTAAATTAAALKHGGGTELYANTIPAVTLPFAMTQWTPQTESTENKCKPPYTYKDSLFSGFRGSHWLSGSCTQDYGSFTVMPVCGKLKTKITDYAVPFSHKNETATSYYYKINLQKQLVAEITSTLRCGMMQFTAQQADSLYLLITPNSDYNQGFIKVDAQKGEIYGYNPTHRIYQGWGKPAGFSGYFVIKIEKNFSTKGTFSGESVFAGDSIKNQKNIGAFVGFKLKAGEKLRIRIGTSFTGIKAARANLTSEIPDFDFEKTVSKAKQTWEKALSQISVKTNNEKDKRIFYTSLYHAMQHPRLYNDVEGTYPKFSSDYQQAKLPQGNYYDDFSLWDIYRAQVPLFEILQPKLVNDLVQSLILKGQQGGWMPIFPCWNSYTSEMVGDHTVSIIASAYLKGIRNYDVKEAYRLLRQNAFDQPKNKADYVEGKGRRALDSYLKYGYVPLEDSVPDAFHKKEQVSRTLEYAYDDYALSAFAKALGKRDDENMLLKRALNYAYVFDRKTGFVRGKYANGTWISGFNPDQKTSFITEGTPRQYTFYVPQDVPGLANLMGGRKELENELDSLFQKNEYWHGNEPGHQIPFMYNFTSSPWKTQRTIKDILDNEYSDGPGGLSGNDDAGQMSAWYLFASMGFYPLNPVSGEYLLCSPIFDQVSIQLPNGKKLEINTHKNSSTSKYIAAVNWNGSPFSKNYITYQQLLKGGKLEFTLQEQPDKNWNTKPENQPSGLSK